MTPLRMIPILAIAFASMLLSMTASSPILHAQLATEPIVKNLMSLGLAHPTTGKLFAGSIVDATTVVGASLQNTDNQLNAVTLDDELVALRGRGVLVAGWGTTAANANAKDLKLVLGTTTICSITDATDSAKDFMIAAVMVLDGVDSQRGYCTMLIDGLVISSSTKTFTATEDVNVAVTLKTTGNNNAAAASAASGKGLVVLPIG